MPPPISYALGLPRAMLGATLARRMLDQGTIVDAPLPVGIGDADAMRERERAGYDRVAETYSANSRAQSGRRETILDAADLHPGMTVLDICAGPGWLTADAARIVAPGGQVVGIDLSPRMRDVAAANAREADVANVEFSVMDAEQLDLSHTTFDRVLCSLGLMHIPNPARALAEVARVLRPDGRAVATVWGPPDETFASILQGSLSAPDEPLSLDYGYILRLGDPATLAGLFRDAGFRDVRVTQVGTPTVFSDAGSFWDNFQRIGGLFGALVRELSPRGQAIARDDFIRRAEAHRADGTIQLPAAQLLAVADR